MTPLGAAGLDSSPGTSRQPVTTNLSKILETSISLNHHNRGCAKIPIPALALARDAARGTSHHSDATSGLPNFFATILHQVVAPAAPWSRGGLTMLFQNTPAENSSKIIQSFRGQQAILRVHHAAVDDGGELGNKK